MFPKKLIAGERGTDQSGERVADVGGGDAVAGEKLLFKREDAEQAVKRAAHLANAALAPGPGLGGHQVDHGNALLVKLTGEAQVEIRRIGQDREVGLLLARFGQQFAVFAVDAGNVGDHFHQAYDRQTGGVHHGAHTGGAQARAGAAEELRLRQNAP